MDGVLLHQALQQHSDGERIRHEVAAVVVGFGLLTQLSLFPYRLPEQLPRRNVHQPRLLCQNGRLGAFAGPRRAKENHVQGPTTPLTDEALVLTHQQLGLQLAHGVQHYPYHNDQSTAGDA